MWLEQRRATAKMEALVGAVRPAGRDGLDPLLYDIGFVDDRGGIGRKRFSEEDAGEVEVRLTLGTCSSRRTSPTASRIWRGRIRPGACDRER